MTPQKGNDEEYEEGGEELVGREGGNGLAEADVVVLEHTSHEEGVAGGEADAPVLDFMLASVKVVE
jgi:hypothetical protein